VLVATDAESTIGALLAEPGARRAFADDETTVVVRG
jgi:hypothetical protein